MSNKNRKLNLSAWKKVEQPDLTTDDSIIETKIQSETTKEFTEKVFKVVERNKLIAKSVYIDEDMDKFFKELVSKTSKSYSQVLKEVLQLGIKTLSKKN